MLPTLGVVWDLGTLWALCGYSELGNIPLIFEVERYETRAQIGDLASFGRHLPLSACAQPEFVLIYRGGVNGVLIGEFQVQNFATKWSHNWRRAAMLLKTMQAAEILNCCNTE